MMNKFILSSTCLLLLSACASQQTPYQRPASPAPETWATTPSAEGAGILASSLTWRQYFNDSQLQALIEQALNHNRDLKIATERVTEARANYRIEASHLPTLYLNSSANRSHTPASVSQNGQAMDSTRYDLGLGIASYELDFWGRIDLMGDAAKAQYLASDAAQQAFRNSLIANVASAYYQILALQERYELAQNTLTSLEKTQELTALKSKVGEIRAANLLSAQAMVLNQQAELQGIQAQQQASRNLLNALVGTQTNVASSSKLSEQALPPNLLAELPDQVLLQRPDVIAAEQKLIAAHINIDSARLLFWPKITLTTSLGLASQALSGLFSGGAAWAFQPLLSVPLFTGDRKENTLTIAEARKNIAVAEYEKTIQQAYKEVSDLLNNKAALNQQLKLQQQAYELSQQRFEKTQSLFKHGQISLLEQQDAERELWAIQQALLGTRQKLLSNDAQLYLALAGAYRPEEAGK